MFIRRNGVLVEVETEVDENELNDLMLEKEWEKRSKKVSPILPVKGKGTKNRPEIMALMVEMLTEKRYTRQDIINACISRFGGKASTYGTTLSDGKNPRYTGFGRLIKQGPNNKVLHF